MSAKSRFLSSVSGVALTAALATISYPAFADNDSASATLPAIAPLNQNTVGVSRIAVEAESSDPLNEVQVLGTVLSNTLANHLNAIGVEITGWDIESSGARDSDSGSAANALAENRVIVTGVIAGTVINPDFAPGTGSYGVLVADDIQTEDARASASDSGNFGDEFDPAYNVSVTATARNIITANGSVAGGSTDSFGVRVDGEVHASFAFATVDVDNFFGPTNQALAVGRALNIVGISGVVGGETASPGSVGFYVAGDVYANTAEVDGFSFFSIDALGFSGLLADVYTTGLGSLDILASNTVQLEGAVTLSGGDGAIGVFVGGNVFAEGALAAGSVRSDGGQLEVSLASGLAVAENNVLVGGAVATSAATGVQIVGDVFATDAAAFGEGIARFGDFYEEVGGASTTAEFTAIAGNAVLISGLAASAGATGIDIGGDVYAQFAEAGAFAGANPFNFDNEANVLATAIAQASNSVSIAGSATANDAIGVAIGEGVFANSATSEALATSYASFAFAAEGPVGTVVAQASVVSTASNAVIIAGVVADSVTNGAGVDPISIFSSGAIAYGSSFASAVEIGGAGATAGASTSVAATNVVGLTGSLGDSVAGSTGVFVDTFVRANNADADGFATANASSTNADTISTAGASATAANDVEASNIVGVVAVLGDTVTGSTGIYIGETVQAFAAEVFGNANATAYVENGGAAHSVATATSAMAAQNTAAVGTTIGTDAFEITGVFIGEGVNASLAFAEGSVGAQATNLNSLGGNATATAQQTVTAGNAAGIYGNIGNLAVDSFGIRVGGDVEATQAFAEGFASANAYVSGGPTITGDALATASNTVGANNVATVSGALGTSSGTTGFWIEGDLVAGGASAFGVAEGFATVDGGGTSDATATVTNLVGANNTAYATVNMGQSTLSAGSQVGESIGAFEAFAQGLANATATGTNTAGTTTAMAGNSVAASNFAGAYATIGDGSSASTGVYVGEGVVAIEAEAAGDAFASASAAGPSVANAAASAVNAIVASNAVSITGQAGANGQGNSGVFIEAPYIAFLPFVGPVPVGAGALLAFAEGTAQATASVVGGTGWATANASNSVVASNGVAIFGAVGQGSASANGVVVDEGSVLAVGAQALGAAVASATKSGGAGDAVATSTSAIVGANNIEISGQVDGFSVSGSGVSVFDGSVVAALAEGAGDFIAGATRNGAEDGNAVASVVGTAAGVNVVELTGTVSGTPTIGIGAEQNIGILVSGDVAAFGALGEGFFLATANRNEGGAGNATATVTGSVVAQNSVSITGGIGAADSVTNGLSSNGVSIGGGVAAAGAVAFGAANVTASRDGDGSIGNAIGTVAAVVVASNDVAIGGSVGGYNDSSFGVAIGEGVTATLAFAEGSANVFTSNTAGADGTSTGATSLVVAATNHIQITGTIGNSDANASTAVSIGEGVTASLAFAEGSTSVTSFRNGAGDGSATATATGVVQAANSIVISGGVGNDIDDASIGVFIGGGVNANTAEAESRAEAVAQRLDAGVGVATAVAISSATAVNTVQITGSVSTDSWSAYGVDPLFVNASDAVASSSAVASANGPAGSTAVAVSTAVAANSIALTGTVAGDPALPNNGSTGVFVLGDVTALNATVSTSNSLTTGGAATGSAIGSAIATNSVSIGGVVGENGDNNVGVDIGGNVRVGGLWISMSTELEAGDGTTITSVDTGSLTNVALIGGAVGDQMTNSQGVYIDGNVAFEGDRAGILSIVSTVPGTGVATVLQVIESRNIGDIRGTVGTGSSGSQGVYIGGDIDARNPLVSNIVIVGVDATNDGTTRGVWIGGSILTGDTFNSQQAQSSGNNVPPPVIPDPGQIGDYVELAGSVFIGANGGLNPHGVAVGDGNDTVLVRDTHFQMEVVNGFDGGSNPDVDGQDRITFSNAQIFVSNIDNFELMNVTNTSAVFLTNPTPYIYAVRDEVNINVSSILSFGDGGAPPPFPIASGSPVNTLQLDTATLTIGGIAGVKSPGPGIDDSILKAENNGTGSYVINGEVFNFGTITLSKVLSAIRGTDPHALDGLSSTSFDTPAEQQFWAITGSWAIDPTSSAGDLLTINGNYTAGSDIILDAFVFKTGSASDVVTINGDVAGVTTLWVNNTNAFGPGALTGRGPTDGILLVDVNNAQDTAVVGAAFVLGNTSGWNWADPVNFPEPEMQVGAFVYDLEQGGADGRNFYLQSQLLDQVPAYTVMTSAIQQHFYAELGTLYQRMGELRHADLGTKANSSFFEFWLRAYGQDVNMDPKEGFEFDMTSKGFMVGGDYAIRNWIVPQSRLHLGGFGGYGWTKLDNIKGDGVNGESDGKTDGYTVGVYATYFDTAKKHQGLYADAVLKFNFLDSEYSSSTRDTKAKSDDFAWGASLEIGYGIGLGGGFIIQPQGQLSYMQTSKEKFKETSPGIPLEVERDKGESLRGRLGLQLQNTWVTSGGTQLSPYIIGNVLHEFMGDNKTTVAGSPFRNDMGGTWYNAGAGFTVDFDNVGLYGHVEYNFGERIEGLAAGLGVKIKLGGSSPVAAAAPPPPAPALVPKKNYIVFFDFDRSNITADAQRVIDEAASAAKAGNSARVQLTGHTDRSGSEQYNMALSLRRGEAVKQALIARGIPANSIFIIGRGENQPLVPTADGVREPQNRRVEIVL